ncbi:MAG: hypothetical protein QY323_01245 [Patescibacteria group bacterium]|nr:MAG: hypothetical protein QY323_01245 [Patescibacteria group bacterium]
MIDIGIDWEAHYGSGWIKRFSAAPAFEAGASLLRGAGLLWIGRYGQGRVVGTSASNLASQMRDLGEHWRAAGLRWTATLLSERGLDGDSAYLLHKFHDRRRYQCEGAPHKHPNAARRLTQAALVMASDRLEIIRASSKRLGGTHNDADLWEDRFETMGETALGTPPHPPFSASEQQALERYAIYRTCEGLTHTAAGIIGARGEFQSGGKTEKASKPWYEITDHFTKKAKCAYEAFAHDASHDPSEHVPLMSVFDTSIPYSEFYERHYSSDAAVYGAAAVIALYVGLLLAAANDEENPLDTRNTFKKAGLDLTPVRRQRALPAADL